MVARVKLRGKTSDLPRKQFPASKVHSSLHYDIKGYINNRQKNHIPDLGVGVAAPGLAPSVAEIRATCLTSAGIVGHYDAYIPIEDWKPINTTLYNV